MTRDQIINSTILKKRFVRDCGLPITVFDNPYFEQRLEIIDSLYNCKSKFEIFCKEAGEFQNEQDYLAWYNTTKDAIITAIKSNIMYEAFNSLELPKPEKKYEKKNLYVEQNDKRSFISIDMKKANFSAMRFFSPAIFDGCETWEDYVSKFTNSQHFADSKYIRQVIFGACNPKKQIRYEAYLMERLCNYIKLNIPNIDIYSLGEDEIIVETHGSLEAEVYWLEYVLPKYLLETIRKEPNGIGNIVRIELFELHKVGNYGWCKNRSESVLVPFKKSFKCIDAEIFHQIVKHYNKQKITEDDLVFYHNGRLARFLKEVDNPWA